MSAKLLLLKGRYTNTDAHSEQMVGKVRYLNPATGCLYHDAEGTRRAHDGFKYDYGSDVWLSGTWAFLVDPEYATPSQYTPTEQPVLVGYVISSAKGPSTILHRTREIAETEALRLAQGNTGVEFTVYPVYRAVAVSKAYTPKPVAKLERL